MDIKEDISEEETAVLKEESDLEYVSDEKKIKLETATRDMSIAEENGFTTMSTKDTAEEEKNAVEIDDANSSSVSSERSETPAMELDSLETDFVNNHDGMESATAGRAEPHAGRRLKNGFVNPEVQNKVIYEGSEGKSDSSSPPEVPLSSSAEHPSSSSPPERPSSSASRSSTHESGAVEFNSELRCEHGGINLDEFRQAVSPAEWKQLSSYFDPATTFVVRCDEPICQECEREFHEQQCGKQELKESLRDLRNRIGELLREIDRRRPTEEEYGTIYSRGICSQFLSKLTATIKARSLSIMLPTICQECVMCTHGLPNVGLSCDLGSVHLVALTEKEWNRICEEIANGLGLDGSARPNPIVISERGQNYMQPRSWFAALIYDYCDVLSMLRFVHYVCRFFLMLSQRIL
ncbi:unnamed protein product [Cylicostephanus goldi]|uniref:USP48 domain-containing protein n=1 Tax=Cylicostephanus goldi TaxID=71465 RepID=A0A3P6SAI6_CYLGO|nr:unnamed protein product [Cylicostephanus goldi]